MSPREFDYAAYLLGELAPEEVAAAERRLSEDPELRERVERLRPVVTRLEELPPEAWQDLSPPAMPPLPGTAPARRRQRAFTLRPLAAAAASLALVAVGVAGGVLVAGEDDDGTAARGPSIALAPPENSVVVGSAPAGTAVTLGGSADRRLEVDVNGLSSTGAQDFYEVWLLGSDGELMSLGSFEVPASGATKVTVPLPVDPGRYGSIDVSREPADGDPAHSKDSVLRGTAL